MFGGIVPRRFTIPVGFMDLSCVNTKTMRRRSDVMLSVSKDTITKLLWRVCSILLSIMEAKVQHTVIATKNCTA
eukprot:12913571-Prorocentrum_lima.AAC.1